MGGRDDELEDGAGGPPWLPTLGQWFLAAAVLLLLPRQWVPASVSMAIGVGLSVFASRRIAR
jgi:hypothetical protein